MENLNVQNNTTEYVIELEDGVLQSHDLEQIVSLAILNSNNEQVLAIHDDGNRAIVEPSTDHEIAPLVGTKTVELERVLVTDGPEIIVSAEDVAAGKQNLAQDIAIETSARHDGLLSKTETFYVPSVMRRQKKTVRMIPNEIEEAQYGLNDNLVNIQPFTADSIAGMSPNWRGYNSTRTIYDYLMYDRFPPEYSQNQKQSLREVKDNYIIIDGHLYFRLKKGKTLRLLRLIHDDQADLKLTIINDCHLTKSGSHAGINRTISQIKEFFFWHGLTEHVRMFIRSCRLCVLKKTMNKEKESFLKDNLNGSVQSPEKEMRAERVDRLSDEVKYIQSKFRPSESIATIKQIKTEVEALNRSISAHMVNQQSLRSGGESGGESDIAGKIIYAARVGDEDIVTELDGRNISSDDYGQNETYEARRVNDISVVLEGEAGADPQNKQMLETMLPRKKIYHNSRLIEEIIGTNEYPKYLTPGQINGLAQVKTHFLMINNELYRVFSKKGKMLYVARVIHDDEPETKKKIMKVFHADESGRHNGMNKTNNLATEAFYWHGMSVHIKAFLEQCPICRCRRGLDKKPSNYVARSDDVSDICLKIFMEPKSVSGEVKANLGLTPDDYREVKGVAQEVKELNYWLMKNPTIKEEWESMYERCSRGPKWYDYGENVNQEAKDSKWYHKDAETVHENNMIKTEIGSLSNKDANSKQLIPDGRDSTTGDVSLTSEITGETVVVSVYLAPDANQEKANDVELLENERTIIVADKTVNVMNAEEIPWEINLDENDEVEEIIIENSDSADNTNVKSDGQVDAIADGETDCIDKTKGLNKIDDLSMKTNFGDGNNVLVSKFEKRKHGSSSPCKTKYLKADKTDDSGGTSSSQRRAEGDQNIAQNDSNPSQIVEVEKASKMLNMKHKENEKSEAKLEADAEIQICQNRDEDKKIRSNISRNEDDDNSYTVVLKDETEDGPASVRRSARKRKFTSKFTGYITSKCLETLSTASICPEPSSRRSNTRSECSETWSAVSECPKQTTRRSDINQRSKAPARKSDLTIANERGFKATNKPLGKAQPIIENINTSLASRRLRKDERKIISNKKGNSKKTKPTIMKNSKLHIEARNPKSKPIMKNSKLHIVARNLRKKSNKLLMKNQGYSIKAQGATADDGMTHKKQKGILMKKNHIYVSHPIALRMAKTPWSFGQSGCIRVNKETKDERIDDHDESSSKELRATEAIGNSNEGVSIKYGKRKPQALDNTLSDPSNEREIAKHILGPGKRGRTKGLMRKTDVSIIGISNLKRSNKNNNAFDKQRSKVSPGLFHHYRETENTKVAPTEKVTCDKTVSPKIIQSCKGESSMATENEAMNIESAKVRSFDISLKSGEKEKMNKELKEIAHGRDGGSASIVRTPNKYLKYNVDYKTGRKSEGVSFQRKYDEFVGIEMESTKCRINCPFCGLLFNAESRINLDKHIERHESVENFHCDECKKMFLNENLLTIHRSIHHDKNVVRCSECNECFPSTFLLSSHIVAQHDVPMVYSCDMCSARFGSKDFLKELTLADGNLSFYSCALCESKT